VIAIAAPACSGLAQWTKAVVQRRAAKQVRSPLTTFQLGRERVQQPRVFLRQASQRSEGRQKILRRSAQRTHKASRGTWRYTISCPRRRSRPHSAQQVSVVTRVSHHFCADDPDLLDADCAPDLANFALLFCPLCLNPTASPLIVVGSRLRAGRMHPPTDFVRLAYGIRASPGLPFATASRALRKRPLRSPIAMHSLIPRRLS
jgi:hypothetical protein